MEFEFRNLSEVEFRENDRGGMSFRGRPAVYDSLSEPLGGFREIIQRGAFDAALANSDDVYLCLNHDPNQLLGRTSSGTIRLSQDERGLIVEGELPDTTLGRDCATLIKRGDLSKMSFAWPKSATRDSWDYTEKPALRKIASIERLVDVSLVTNPAYAATSAEVRSSQMAEAILQDVEDLLEERVGKKLSQQNLSHLMGAMAALKAVLDGADAADDADTGVEENAQPTQESDNAKRVKQSTTDNADVVNEERDGRTIAALGSIIAQCEDWQEYVADDEEDVQEMESVLSLLRQMVADEATEDDGRSADDEADDAARSGDADWQAEAERRAIQLRLLELGLL